ncbi:Fe-S-containing hydro-lyase [Dethiobacter alkaliphilus]|uniref:Hydro-lyase, Fe-S type, tartrate/fumarate subfamily, beta subunit n=1 Tax=Dethiobacter alkaliphilus AHT 1 TaxID=555088 RepID=C0GJW6_DETAL|nr:Fe-S-containing hydro-lyase [Dethiobacter alkaliphilus]EEG76335.1 hydro-lyase, Fe-S type, tartrate/fumarate subfamily, beta subunit [Dethiobacter alkaliphilus AHT 1]
MTVKRISAPLSDEDIMELKAGDNVLISGVIYTGRDAAHKKLTELVEAGEPLPVDFTGQMIYYVGPSPAKPGKVIGSAGPTTSGRMDAYTPTMLEQGLKACIGKGSRNKAVKDALVKHKAVYLASTGGAAALLARTIKKAEVVAYPELGPEAIYRLEVEDFPATVVNDAHGTDIYEVGRQEYALND